MTSEGVWEQDQGNKLHGKAIYLEKGWGNFNDPLHNGAYVKMPGYDKSSLSDSKGVIRVPLEGNPTLK